MTTASFSAMVGHTARAIAAGRNEHCQPPTFKPAALVGGRIDCPKCGSALNYRVTADGQTHGRCVAAACIKWSNA